MGGGAITSPRGGGGTTSGVARCSALGGKGKLHVDSEGRSHSYTTEKKEGA